MSWCPGIPFSNDETALMARRARQMLPLLRDVSAELADLELPVLVKLGCRIDGGGPTDCEHMWFQVHGFEGDAVDATLINAPFRIARLQKGDRAVHSLDAAARLEHSFAGRRARASDCM